MPDHVVAEATVHEPLRWIGRRPTALCDTCGGAEVRARRCLEHLGDPDLPAMLDELRRERVPLDLRGVTISARRWAAVAAAMREHGGALNLQRTALLENATFGAYANLAGAVFERGSNLNGIVFKARCVLTGAEFGDGTKLTAAVFGDGVDLSEASFGDDVSLEGARFGRYVALGAARFGDRTSLSRAQFLGDVFVLGATFGDGANLELTKFGGRAIFARSSFGADSTFKNSRLESDAPFNHATFGANAQFAEVSLDGSLGLSGAAFTGPQLRLGPCSVAGMLDLSEARFDQEVRLDVEAKFIDLRDAVFGGPATISLTGGRTKANNVRFGDQTTLVSPPGAGCASLRSLEGVDVSNVTIVGMDVSGARFAGATNLNKLRFIDTTFAKRDGRQRLYEELCVAAPEDVLAQGDDPTGCDAEQVAELYRMLRKGREESADVPGGNDLYVGEQVMRREALSRLDQKDLGVYGRIAILWLYNVVGGWGVRPARPTASFVVVFLTAWMAATFGHLVRPSASSDRNGVTLQVRASAPQPRTTTPGVTLALSAGQQQPRTGHAHPVTDAQRLGPAAVYVVRSMLLLPTSSNVDTTTGADALQAALRLLGPLLLGLVALGLRAQVKR